MKDYVKLEKKKVKYENVSRLIIHFPPWSIDHVNFLFLRLILNTEQRLE